MLNSVRTSNPIYGGFSSGTTNVAPGNASHFTSSPHLQDSPGQLNHASSPLHFTVSSSLYHQPPTAPAAFYSAQHRASPGFTGGYAAEAHSGVGAPAGFLMSTNSQLVGTANATSIATDEICPVPIPLPSEVGHGQSLTMGTFSSEEMANVAVCNSAF